jgi:hypothetical protein
MAAASVGFERAALGGRVATICIGRLFCHAPSPAAPVTLALFATIAQRCRTECRCDHFVWQFAHLQRFLNKRVDWATVGIANVELTEQDYLLDWRQGGVGLRYVYHFKDAELVALCGKPAGKCSHNSAVMAPATI